MTARNTILAIGECMIEFSQSDNNGWKLGFAGDTFNTAWHFNRNCNLERWNTAYFTRLGKDPFSERMASFIEESGISTRWIARDEKRQAGLYLIETIRGERSFTYWRENSAARLLADDPDLLAEAVQQADCVYFSGITLAILSAAGRATLLDILRALRETAKPVAFDPNIRPRLWESSESMTEWISTAAKVASIVMPGADEQAEHFGDASTSEVVERYLRMGALEVVVKNGGGPVLAATPNEHAEFTDTSPVTPLDTTGAGDSFNGAYLARRLDGCSLQSSLEAAHSCARKVIQHHGALSV